MKCIFIFQLMLTALVSTAGDYIVAPGGKDSITYGTIAKPFATIQYALQYCQPGDTVKVRAGNYKQFINWPVSGTYNRWITLKNYNNESAVIDGTGLLSTFLLQITNINYCRVEGLNFQKLFKIGAAAINIIGTAKNISVINCRITDIGWTSDATAHPVQGNDAHGILIKGTTVSGIDTVTVRNCRLSGIITGNSEALTVTGNTDIFYMDSDTVYNTTNIGIDIAGHFPNTVDSGVHDSLNQARNGTVSNCVAYQNRRPDNGDKSAGIYIDGGKNILVIGNTCYNNMIGMSVGCETPGKSADNITLMNNKIYANDEVGLSFGSGSGTSTVTNSIINNNTFFRNNLITTFGLEIRIQNSSNNRVVNNIIVPDSDSDNGIAVPGYTSTGLVSDNNLFYRYSGYFGNLSVDGQFTSVNSVYDDPQFLNTSLSSPNFMISRSSPGIDHGSNFYPLATDKDAGLNFRLVNGIIDIGAFEAQDGSCPPALIINDLMLLAGRFIARDTITFMRTQPAMVADNLVWSCPVVNIKSSITTAKHITIQTQGCN